MGFKTVATEGISFSTNKIEQKIDLDNLASDLSEKEKNELSRVSSWTQIKSSNKTQTRQMNQRCR